MKIKIKKLSPSKNPKIATAERKDYRLGYASNDKSLFVDYEAIGEAQEKPKVGSSFKMLRYERNGVKCLGFFVTSEIVKVEDNTFETQNSIYEWEEIKETL